ncbi:unnamed protein product [Ixodes pacificus]
MQVSYPRTGTHLVQQMIQLIVNGGQSARTLTEFTQRSPFLEIQGPQETSEAPRLLRTHLPMNRLRLSGKAKYVYVARNPWDCCVSNFHLMRDFPAFRFADGNFEDFLDLFLDGQFGFGDYFNHVISGHSRRHDANVFFVTYEEIVKDRAGVVLKMADFLGEGYGEMLRTNDKVMELIVERTGVDFMRDVFETPMDELWQVFGRGLVPTGSAAERIKATKMATRNLVRKGAVGDCRSHFSQESMLKMQKKIDDTFKGTDIMSLWMREEICDML